MSSRYIGTFRPEKDATSPFWEGDGSKSHVRTLSSAYGSTAIAAEEGDQIQVSKIGRTLCLVAPPPTAGISRASGKSYADAIVREWQKRGVSLFHEEDVTASIVLCDAASDQIILARAQNGVPPIFFTETQDTLSWSNSIKALLQHGVDSALDHRALDAYFALGYIPAPWTLFKTIRKVPSGQFLDWKQGDWTFRKHREPISQSRKVRDLDTGAAELKQRLCQSLDQIVDGHDRVGVLLSSGVDSSLLVGLLHCELGAEVEAFTFEYSGYNGKYNEYSQAQRLTRQYNIPHHRIDYSGEWLESNLQRAVRQYEEPFTYGHHTARLEPVKERDISLLLSGVTGEMFISRTASYALRIDNSILQRAAAAVDTALETWGAKNHSRLGHLVDIISSPPEKIFYENTPVNRVVPDPTRLQLYEDKNHCKHGRESILSLFKESLDGTGLTHKIDQLSHLKSTFIVPDHILFWNHRWGRAHGIEIGAPYFAPVVGSWMESLQQPLWPPHKESIRKILIRRAAATLMPEELAYNQKIAQTAPFWTWFQGPLRSLLRKYLSPPALREVDLFDVEFVQRTLRRHITGTGKQPYLIWSLLCFMVWKETLLESGDFT